MATAGRTVAVSGITVAISLAGLLIFPQVFLRSMGFGGMSAVLIAMVAALLLPALLAMLGPKVDALSVRPWLRRVFRRAPAGGDDRATTAPGRGSRTASCGVRSSSPSASVALLIVLALPFLRVQFGGIDERALPAGTESRVVAETIASATSRPTRPGRSRRSSPCRRGRLGRRRAALQSYVDAVADVPGWTARP